MVQGFGLSVLIAFFMVLVSACNNKAGHKSGDISVSNNQESVQPTSPDPEPTVPEVVEETDMTSSTETESSTCSSGYDFDYFPSGSSSSQCDASKVGEEANPDPDLNWGDPNFNSGTATEVDNGGFN